MSLGGAPRRILVTGATGFVGRRVVEQLLAEGDSVVALVRPGAAIREAERLTVAPCDLSGEISAVLAKVGATDCVVHLAQAPGWHDFPRTAGDIAALSVTATCRLAEYACAVGASNLVYASSGGVYGPATGPLVEGDPLKPAAELGFYLGAKAAAETLLGHFAGQLGVQILRPFFLYGPGQSPSFLMPRLLRSVAAGDAIRVAGGRGPKLNPLFVSDAARAVVAACRRAGSLTVNIAGDETATLADIARMIGVMAGRDPVFDVIDEAPADYVADIGLMKSELVPPSVGLQAGIRMAGGRS